MGEIAGANKVFVLAQIEEQQRDDGKRQDRPRTAPPGEPDCQTSGAHQRETDLEGIPASIPSAQRGQPRTDQDADAQPVIPILVVKNLPPALAVEYRNVEIPLVPKE